MDIKTGLNSGAIHVGETWGFRDEEELLECGAKYIIHKPAQLVDIIRELSK